MTTLCDPVQSTVIDSRPRPDLLDDLEFEVPCQRPECPTGDVATHIWRSICGCSALLCATCALSILRHLLEHQAHGCLMEALCLICGVHLGPADPFDLCWIEPLGGAS